MLEAVYSQAQQEISKRWPVFRDECGMTSAQPLHVPVLVDEVLQWLEPQPGEIIVDGTVGGGGHARMLAERVLPGGRLVGLDRDRAALATAEQQLRGLPVQLHHANFCDLPDVLKELGIERVDKVLLDLGVSSDQLADRERGFSFDSDGPLDMRMDTSQGEPAWKLLERLSADELADLIYRFGEERYSRRIARRIVQRRQQQPIRTAAELAQIVRACVPPGRRRHFDPATRTFQALRIAVNAELESLRLALERVPACLRPGGRLAVISFHSLEDRLVKHAFRSDPRLRPLTKKPVRPSEQEKLRNPRSRSARLRVAERVAE